MLKWLTLEGIKAQCRIEPDFHDEDDLLVEIGEGAEETVLNLCNRTYENLIETYGKVPVSLIRASKLLVDIGYQYRSPVSGQNMYLVPYALDIMLKPYMRLASAEYEQNNGNRYGCKNL